MAMITVQFEGISTPATDGDSREDAATQRMRSILIDLLENSPRYITRTIFLNAAHRACDSFKDMA
jgi:signal transduction histidine kinase